MMIPVISSLMSHLTRATSHYNSTLNLIIIEHSWISFDF